jgi:hypothetical protein
LEQLWLADARREHGMVALIGRTTWLLTATGAPAPLVARMQRAGLAKLGHAQTSFAIAAGYGRRTLGVEPRAELLTTRFDEKANPLVTQTRELIESGCLFSDFRASVARERAVVCTDPVVRQALIELARDDAERAELSWEVLRWMLHADRSAVHAAGWRMIRWLPNVFRPAWGAPGAESWVSAQSFDTLAALGIMGPKPMKQLFERQLEATQRRLRSMFGPEAGNGAEISAYD